VEWFRALTSIEQGFLTALVFVPLLFVGIRLIRGPLPPKDPDLPFLDHACMTGDCAHERQAECDATLASEYRRIARRLNPIGREPAPPA
jgi:hypothetical protein